METNTNYYDYLKRRRAEKRRSKSVTAKEAQELIDASDARELVWKYLLKTEDSGNSAFLDYHYHSYQPKPHPEDINANEAQILILESQRRFLQMIDRSIIDGQDVYHMDLSSAYLTSLANVKHSLKYSNKYPLSILRTLDRSVTNVPIHKYVLDDLFNIVKVRLEMPYDNRINIFASNQRIKYKGKIVSETNYPPNGEKVQVILELFVSKLYNIDSWNSFTTIFKNFEIDYKKIDVFTYEYIERKEIYDMTDVKLLLELMKTDESFQGDMKKHYKQAIVSFTGQLMNIDPGRRLIMLASNEEVMRRLYIILSRYTTVYGLQIDGIYFDPFDWPKNVSPLDIVYTIGQDVYGQFPPGYSKDIFSKLELWDSSMYRIRPFRLQEVHD